MAQILIQQSCPDICTASKSLSKAKKTLCTLRLGTALQTLMTHLPEGTILGIDLRVQIIAPIIVETLDEDKDLVPILVHALIHHFLAFIIVHDPEHGPARDHNLDPERHLQLTERYLHSFHQRCVV